MSRTNLTTFRLCAAFACCKGSDKFGPDGRIPRGWRMHPTVGPLCPRHSKHVGVWVDSGGPTLKGVHYVNTKEPTP